MKRTALTALTALALATPALAAPPSSGGGSSVQAGQVAQTSFMVSGIGTVTRVGPRHSAAATLALYRIPPGRTAGRLVASRQVAIAGRAQVTTLIVRVGCKPTRQPQRWFVSMLARSKSTRASAPVALKSVGPTFNLRCGA